MRRVKHAGVIIGVETEHAVAEAALRPSSEQSASGAAPAPSPRAVAVAVDVDERLAALARALGRSPADDAHHRTLAHNASAVVSELTSSLPHLPAERAGAFFPSGARCYVDCYKAEYATPETRSPADAVCHVLAGRKHLDAAARRCNERSKDGSQLRIYAQHVDYDATGAHTWGVHENYAPPAGGAGPEVVRDALGPHLATRTLFGAGGFSPDPDQPLQFVRSPRVLLLCRGAASAGDVCNPMFHARGPVTWGAQRYHLICCESLRSHVGTYLTLGTTALVVHLAARKIGALPDFTPAQARQALARFAADAGGRTRVRCAAGGPSRSALEIQQHLCDMAHRARDTGATEGLPWVDELLATWDWFLAEYARRGREGLCRSIDWAIKYDLFTAHCLASSSGTMTFERLLEWNRPLAWIVRQFPSFRTYLADPSQLPREIVTAPPPGLNARMIRVWERAGLLWDHLPTVLRLRLELRELDWRYAQIGDGIFDRLEAGGVLRHAAPGVTPEAIQRACDEAPTDTRARIRGATIVAWAGKRRHAAARCEWNRITDPGTQEIIHMPDPFEPDAQPQRWEASPDGATQLFDRAIAFYRTSHFAAAWRLLARLRAANPWANGNPREENAQPFRLFRYTAWVAARLGRTDAIDYLRTIHGDTIDPSSMLKVADHLYCYRFMGLAPHPKSADWLGAAEELMRREAPADEPLGAAVREHVGAWHLHHGRLDLVEDAIGPAAREECTWRRARIQAILAELHRRRSDDDRARKTLADVAQQMSASAFDVLIAEQITPMQARLAPDPGERTRLYDQAARVLLRARHPMGLARVLVLKARDGDDASKATTIRSRVNRLARVAVSLGQCELTRSLLSRWDEWCSAACGQNLL